MPHEFVINHAEAAIVRFCIANAHIHYFLITNEEERGTLFTNISKDDTTTRSTRRHDKTYPRGTDGSLRILPMCHALSLFPVFP